jgi:hypothetical protein
VKFARFHLNLSSQSCILGYCSGKVILAASFHSGNIQAFSYGPHPTPSLPPQSGLISTSKLSHLDDRIYAWGLPSKVVAPRASPNNWATILDSSMDFFQQEYNKAAPSKRTWDHLAGLVLLPRDFQKVHRLETQDDCRGFSLMQLTGEGNILAQCRFSSFSDEKLRCGPNWCVLPCLARVLHVLVLFNIVARRRKDKIC